MRVIQFIFSILIIGCTGAMLVSAIISPETYGKIFSIIAYSILFVLSIVLVKLTYEEVRSF